MVGDVYSSLIGFWLPDVGPRMMLMDDNELGWPAKTTCIASGLGSSGTTQSWPQRRSGSVGQGGIHTLGVFSEVAATPIAQRPSPSSPRPRMAGRDSPNNARPPTPPRSAALLPRRSSSPAPAPARSAGVRAPWPPARPSPQTRPRPLLRSLHQPCTLRVAFHVTQYRVAVVVRFDRERLEAVLVDVAAAGRCGSGPASERSALASARVAPRPARRAQTVLVSPSRRR